MLKRQLFCEGSYCPFVKAARTAGDPWVLLIIRSLLDGPLGFNQIADAVNGADTRCISSRTLSQRLKDLESAEVLVRDGEEVARPRYALTEKGHSLAPVIQVLEEYGQKYC